MPASIPFPVLPAAPSWFPGHMVQFQRLLPKLLTRTDVVLELRDARLPLTSINRNFEGALERWRKERGHFAPRKSVQNAAAPPSEGPTGLICERIVVFNKRDLVPEWGIEPFSRAMAAKYPDQKVFFASWNKPRDIRALNDMLIDIARRNPHLPELNVLVVGMPNVGKSTLLNALRANGIPGPTAKALRTSAQPGLTRALSTRLKLSLDPPVYSFDSPGVMMPFLGKGDRGAERGVKLALIAGIKEGLYDTESLAAYLIYRLNMLDPVAPAYLPLLPPGTRPLTDIYVFLDVLARRLNMLKRGGVPDMSRAATWFIRWWREEGARAAAAAPLLVRSAEPQAHRRGWSFDLEWDVAADEVARYDKALVQRKMEECIARCDVELAQEEEEGGSVSKTQTKKRAKQELMARRVAKHQARLLASKAGR
ncbi:hypothetical protein CERSUDRAFT_116270 [Gelatoporia subvermispora B]|uniref:G domain-containing protein n=1 Tax=Ceriporiopsis subvermispora (strain B) TaxID=914234 RepID=M2RAS4_CERS8|nr:hypothetical protein CERSUDRAFT_116270 [Gelatoporia subvermispora B]